MIEYLNTYNMYLKILQIQTITNSFRFDSHPPSVVTDQNSFPAVSTVVLSMVQYVALTP